MENKGGGMYALLQKKLKLIVISFSIKLLIYLEL